MAIAQLLHSVVPSYPKQYAQADSGSSSRPMSARPSEQKDSEPYEANCERPKDREEADLCQQARMAKAAEDLVTLTDWQVWLTKREIAALVLTLLATTAAASAAIWAVWIARSTARQELRAYVSMNPNELDLMPGKRPTIVFHPKNHGQTPAYGLRHCFEIEILPEPLPNGFAFPVATRKVNTNFALYHGEEDPKTWFHGARRTTVRDLLAIAKGRARLHVWGETQFRDVFGKTRRVKFNASAGGRSLIESQISFHKGRGKGPGWNWAWGEGHNDGT